MTTRIQAERVLFDAEISTQVEISDGKISTNLNKTTRRRVDATYCPICQGWVEVRLRPVRLHCTGCQREARL